MDLTPGHTIKQTRVRFTSLLASFILALAVVRLASVNRDPKQD
jgi:hypothetical protein